MKNIFKINFKVNKEILSGIKVAKSVGETPSVLFLHGGGEAEKNRTLYLMERLVEKDVNSLSFDHSGSGESSGEVNDSSLEKRLDEAREALRFCSEDVTVCGSSMGGYIALKTLETDLNVKNLILFCPAVYDKKAFDLKFGKEFTKTIRRKESWRDSDVFDLLEKFEGNLLIVIGDNDEVIPKGVIALLDKHSPNVKKKKIIKLEDVSHSLHKELSKKDDLVNVVLENILDFIK